MKINEIEHNRKNMVLARLAKERENEEEREQKLPISRMREGTLKKLKEHWKDSKRILLTTLLQWIWLVICNG